MGKRIIQQARGHGSLTYRVRKKAYKYRIRYPNIKEGKGEILKIIKSPAHSAPILKIKVGKKIFFNLAPEEIAEGQQITFGGTEIGDIAMLKDIEVGKQIFNIENHPGDGGKLVRTAGSSATIIKKGREIRVKLASGKERILDKECRATIGVISGGGKKEKPLIKAGRKYYKMKSKNKLWPRTSAVKMNAIDHPFGSGRGKNLAHGKKGKTPKINAPVGAKVGSLRPKRTGRRKK